jgi:hypothetical protein
MCRLCCRQRQVVYSRHAHGYGGQGRVLVIAAEAVNEPFAEGRKKSGTDRTRSRLGPRSGARVAAAAPGRRPAQLQAHHAAAVPRRARRPGESLPTSSAPRTRRMQLLAPVMSRPGRCRTARVRFSSVGTGAPGPAPSRRSTGDTPAADICICGDVVGVRRRHGSMGSGAVATLSRVPPAPRGCMVSRDRSP